MFVLFFSSNREESRNKTQNKNIKENIIYTQLVVISFFFQTFFDGNPSVPLPHLK